MEIKQVTSYTDLQEKLKSSKKNYVLIYKSGSQQSDCAYKNLSSVSNTEGIQILGVDVATVRDVHKNYNVTTAPTLLEFEGKKISKAIKGCHDSSYYKAMFENALFVSQANTEDKKAQKNVVVYTTPSCPWCNRLKQYLRMHKVRFRDIDVSKDPKLAQDLVRKSGHQGVPQTEIDGKIIVGFDKKKIDTLLGLKG